MAQGLSNQQIADSLVISERTARTHVSNILGKLGVASRTQAALLAIREHRAGSVGGLAPGDARPMRHSSHRSRVAARGWLRARCRTVGGS